MERIELRHLRYFVAVAEEGHVTRAAARLGLQQPPLSQQIRALEQIVGADLFRRLPRGVALTEPGETLLRHARQVLADVDHALDAARRTARGEQGRLAVGFTSSAAFHPLVTSVIRSFRQTAGDVALSLEESSSAELVEALLAERLDVAFVRAVDAAPPGLILEPLEQEEMIAAVPEGHALARAADQALPLADLARETFILYRRPAGPGLYDRVIAACRAAGFSPQVGQEAPRLVSTLSLVAAGLGVSVVPASMRTLETGGVIYRRLQGAAGLSAPLQLAVRSGPSSGAAERLLAVIRQARAARASVQAG